MIQRDDHLSFPGACESLHGHQKQDGRRDTVVFVGLSGDGQAGWRAGKLHPTPMSPVQPLRERRRSAFPMTPTPLSLCWSSRTFPPAGEIRAKHAIPDRRAGPPAGDVNENWRVRRGAGRGWEGLGGAFPTHKNAGLFVRNDVHHHTSPMAHDLFRVAIIYGRTALSSG